MQTLIVGHRRADGTETLEEVQIIQVWSKAGAGDLYLHADGTYGSKAGVPVASEAELREFITGPAALAQALAWWRARGRAASEDAQQAQRDKEASLAALGDASVVQPGAELDAVTYRRRKLGRGGAVSAPMTWQAAGFAARPDWWGVASLIAIREFQYEIDVVAGPTFGQDAAPDEPEGDAAMAGAADPETAG